MTRIGQVPIIIVDRNDNITVKKIDKVGPLIFHDYGIADGITESDHLKQNPYSVKITVT